MNVRRSMAGLGAFVLAMAPGCAATVPAPPAQPAAAPTPVAEQSDVLPDAIPWSPARLTWADFKGEPVRSGAAAAVTTYVIRWKADCSSDGFSFDVIAAFIPDQSWVRPSVLDRFEESQRALGHEQTHFDISEVHARKMRQVLGRLTRPCAMTEEELYAVAAPIVRADQDTQALYDSQTAHGLNTPQQVSWQRDVARQLASLSRYTGTASRQAAPKAGAHRDRERRVTLRRGPGWLSPSDRHPRRPRAAAGR